jgi:CRP-like cAMP-binding protein
MRGEERKFQDLLRGHPFLFSMQPSHLKILAETARISDLQAGDILFRQGDPANRLFLICSGKIELEAACSHPCGATVNVETLGQGEVLGWSWLIPPFSWNLQARAIEATKVIVVESAHLLAACEEDAEFGCELMKRIAQVMAHRFQSLRKQLVEEHESNLAANYSSH